MGWMGPVVGDVEHEGWVVPVFADGVEGAGSSSARGVLVDFDRDEWRPDEGVTAWRAGCECGWRGPLWTRVKAADGASPDPWVSRPKRLIHNPGEWPADLHSDAENAVIDEWRQHIAPWRSVELVEEAAQRASAASRALDDAVRTAHASGASWADIGRAVGISRQSAHERWAS